MELSKKQLRYMLLAKKLAKFSNHKQHHIGAVLVRNSNIISMGFNSLKTHPKAKTFSCTLHAELATIIGMDYKDTKGSIIYIYRQTSSGDLALSKPCLVCEEALRLAGVKKAVYTDYNNYSEIYL